MPKCELCRLDVEEAAIRQRTPRALSALAPADGGDRVHAICDAAQSAVAADDPPGIADRPHWWICDACLAKHFVQAAAHDARPPAELDIPDFAKPEAPAELPDYPEAAEVRLLLARLRRAWWRTHFFTGLFLYAAVALGAVAAAVGLEVLFGLPPPLRRALALGVFGAGAGGFLGLVVFRLFFRRSDEQVALLVERAFPQIDNGLINAVRLAKDPSVPSRELAAAAIHEGLDRAHSVRLSDAVDKANLRRCAWAAGLALLLAAGLAVGLRGRAWNAARRLAAPGREMERVGAVRIVDVRPGDRLGEDAMLSGDALLVEAEIEPTEPMDLDAWLSVRTADGDARNLRMRMAEDTLFQGEIRDVRSPLSYRVHVADSATRFYQVEVVEPPQIVRLDVELEYPAYTGLPPKREEDTDGTVRAVVGTQFRLSLRADRRLRSARMLLGRRMEEIGMELLGEGMFAEMPEPLPVETDQTYVLRIVDQRGASERHPIQRHIRAILDAPPNVVLAAPGRDVTVAPGDTVPIAVRASDDFGMSRAALVARLRREGGESDWFTVHEWPRVPEGTRIVLSHDWEFSEKDYQSGDVLRYYVWVEDNNDVSGPGVGRSSEYEVRVESPERVEAERVEAYRTWQERVQAILEDQTRLRERTKELEERVGGEP